MTRTAQFKLFAIIAIFAGPALAYWGYKAKNDLGELEKNGTTVPGIISGGESKSGRGSYKKFSVEYKQADGKVVTREFKVRSDYFQAHTSGNSVSDPNAQVRYLPGSPENAMIVGGSTDNTHMLNLGIGAFIVGLLVFGFMKLRGL